MEAKYINKVNDIQTIENLKDIFGNGEFSYFQPLINLSVGPDYKDSNINILYISNSNLGLGNSFYYKDNSGEYFMIVRSICKECQT